MRDALQKIGLDADSLTLQVQNGSLTQFQAIQKISEALNQYGANSQEAGQVLTAVFGKSATVIGVDFFKSLSKTNLSLEETLKNADAVESANLRIAAATEEIDKVTVALFGNSSTLWTEVKADVLEIAANVLTKVIKGTVDLINEFITLYNESLLFRVAVQDLILPFKLLWDIVSNLFTYLIDGFKNTGAIIKAIITGHFSDIPQIIKDGFEKNMATFKQLGSDMFDSFKGSVEAAVNNKPIALINLDSSNEQATVAGAQAAKAFTKSFTDQSDYLNNAKDEKPKDVQLPLAKGATVKGLPDNFNPTIKTANQQLGYTYSVVEKVGMAFKENIENGAVNAINMLGNSIANNVSKGITSLADFGNAFVQTTKQVIAAALAQATADAILSAADIPFPGNIVAAGVAVGAISALFAAIPAFEQGGVVGSGSNLIRMNEKGGELAIMPTGSVIIPHDLSARLVGNVGGSNVSIALGSRLKGTDIYLQQKEVVRRRNNTI